MAHREVTWVVVADGAEARVFVKDGAGRHLTELADGHFSGARKPSHEIGTDRPGRAFDSAGAGRHAMEPTSDPHDLAEKEFLQQVLDWLAEQEQSGKFDQLVLIAAPKALGHLRKSIPPAVAKRTIAEIDSDLTHETAAQIEARLADLLAF